VKAVENGFSCILEAIIRSKSLRLSNFYGKSDGLLQGQKAAAESDDLWQKWIISGKSRLFSGIIVRIKTKSGGRNMRCSQALAQMISGSYKYNPPILFFICFSAGRRRLPGSQNNPHKSRQ
jgi:hypothetical protein